MKNLLILLLALSLVSCGKEDTSFVLPKEALTESNVQRIDEISEFCTSGYNVVDDQFIYKLEFIDSNVIMGISKDTNEMLDTVTRWGPDSPYLFYTTGYPGTELDSYLSLYLGEKDLLDWYTVECTNTSFIISNEGGAFLEVDKQEILSYGET